jgi:hypothetical protein
MPPRRVIGPDHGIDDSEHSLQIEFAAERLVVEKAYPWRPMRGLIPLATVNKI